MNALRWTLTAVTALVALGFVALLVWAEGFRRSFGASANGPLVAGAPLAVMGVVLASLIWPEQRLLLHLAALLVVAVTALSVWLLRESVFLGTAGLLFGILWLAWYRHAATASAAP